MSSPFHYGGKQVLITGGLGFIGSNLAIALVGLGAEVTIVDAMLPQYGGRLFNIDPVRERVDVHVVDLRDSAPLTRLVSGKNVIFNLAGQMSHVASMRDPITDLEINCRSQLSLLECCRAANREGRMVLASTRQVYGRPQHLPIDETHPTVPVDINGIHKIAAETYHLLYERVHGLSSVILRLTNTYGPRMDLVNSDKGLLGTVLRRALLGETVQIFGSGEQRRDFNYVDDVVEALLLAGSCEDIAGVFNLGHPEPYRLIDFVALLREITGCRFEHVPFPADQRAIDIGDYFADFGKFRERTGWQPKVDLREGLDRTVAFFRQHSGEYLAAS